MCNGNSSVILGDTNAAYKLYFFMKKGVIPQNNITVSGLGKLLFHQIVHEEVESHVEAWRVMNEYGHKSKDIPAFFATVGQEVLDEILSFVLDNLDTNQNSVDEYSDAFARKRKVYEAERVRLQNDWVKQNVKGKKVTSKPSMNDYKLLYSVDVMNCKLVTHDEILLAVAREFLNEGETLKSEDILNRVLRNDPTKKSAIEDAITNLEFMQERIDRARIFRP